MVHVVVDAVSKNFQTENLIAAQTRAALHAVDLDIGDGETIAVVGPSGCGKSTLLKIVAGLERPDSGEIRFDGTDVTALQPQHREVGMVFQDYALYPSMKASGNLQYYFDHRGRDLDADARVEETARIMGIDFGLLLGQTPGTLSGGQQQRVAIGRCIVRDPTLFLMDEPICNLDAKLREQTRIEMKKLLRRFKVTTLYVTHDQSEAIFMGDRIAVMRDGRIEQLGTYDDLYYSPANLFVATFIGAPPMTVLPAPSGRGAGTRIGVRPEGWTLPQGPAELRLEVTRVERLQAERTSYLRGTIGGYAATVAVGLDHPAAAGDSVAVAPDPEQLYLFDENDATVASPAPPELF